jgi:cell division protein ZapA
MGIISIKIKISDREYPMKVDESEEEIIRAAGKKLVDKLKNIKDQYQIEDKQDLLSIAAFDSILELLKIEQATQKNEAIVLDKISYLNSLISKSV